MTNSLAAIKALFFPPKIGDRVKVTNVNVHFTSFFNVGDIGVIVQVYNHFKSYKCNFDQPENPKVYQDGVWSVPAHMVERIE